MTVQTPPPSTTKPVTNRRRFADLNTGWVTVIVALLTLASGYVGAQVGANASFQVSQSQIQEQREVRSKEKRADTYSAYLEAANEFSGAAHGLDRVYKDSMAKLSTGQIKAGENMPHLVDAQNLYLTSRTNYQKTINNVYVYGSDSAWDKHLSLAATLPPSLSGGDVVFPPPEVPNVQEFKEAYRGFQTVVCREVAAIAREGCGS